MEISKGGPVGVREALDYYGGGEVRPLVVERSGEGFSGVKRGCTHAILRRADTYGVTGRDEFEKGHEGREVAAANQSRAKVEDDAHKVPVVAGDAGEKPEEVGAAFDGLPVLAIEFGEFELAVHVAKKSG